MEQKSRYKSPPRLWVCVASAVGILTAVSCTAKTEIQLTHLQGKLACMRNDWDTAILHFFSAEAAARDSKDAELHTYTEFALGSVYLLQNEEDAAWEKFEAALQKAPLNLQAQGLYQKGIIAFKKQDYSSAAALFKQTLVLDSSDIDAKINYELSKKLCIRTQEALQKQPIRSTEQTEPEYSEDNIMLDIMRQRELMKWEKMQHQPQSVINDY